MSVCYRYRWQIEFFTKHMCTKQKSLLGEEKRNYEKLLNSDARFKRLNLNEQGQILNVLVKKKNGYSLKKVALSIVMDARGY